MSNTGAAQAPAGTPAAQAGQAAPAAAGSNAEQAPAGSGAQSSQHWGVELEQMGITKDIALRAISFAQGLATPEGQAKLIKAVATKHGDQIFNERLAERLKTSEQRRLLRRIVDRAGPNAPEPEAETSGFGGESDDMPAWARKLQEDNAALREEISGLRGTAASAEQTAQGTLKALSRSAMIEQFMKRNAAAANAPEEFTAEVAYLLDQQPDQYAGQAGVELAANQVLSRWDRLAKAQGYSKPEPAAQASGPGGIPSPAKGADKETVSKMFAEGKIDDIAKMVSQTLHSFGE